MFYLWFADIRVVQGFKNGYLQTEYHPVCVLFFWNITNVKKREGGDKQHLWVQRYGEPSLHQGENNTPIFESLLRGIGDNISECFLTLQRGPTGVIACVQVREQLSGAVSPSTIWIPDGTQVATYPVSHLTDL